MKRDLERRLSAVEARRGRVAPILRRIAMMNDEELIAGIRDPEAYPLCDLRALTDAELEELSDELQKRAGEICSSREPDL
jgi:hypothetical protein